MFIYVCKVQSENCKTTTTSATTATQAIQNLELRLQIIIIIIIILPIHNVNRRTNEPILCTQFVYVRNNDDCLLKKKKTPNS